MHILLEMQFAYKKYSEFYFIPHFYYLWRKRTCQKRRRLLMLLIKIWNVLQIFSLVNIIKVKTQFIGAYEALQLWIYCLVTWKDELIGEWLKENIDMHTQIKYLERTYSDFHEKRNVSFEKPFFSGIFWTHYFLTNKSPNIGSSMFFFGQKLFLLA
jgi:hypothetical protein